MEILNNNIQNLRVSAGKQGAADSTSIGRAVVKIKVFGVGGGGGNVLKRLAEGDLKNVEFIAVNTDTHALSLLNNETIKAIQIGGNEMRGRGTGGKVEVGEIAAKKAAERLKNMMLGSDLIFITAGMGGGTGTGAAPVIAEIAKKLNILTVGVVTVPFGFEGTRKQRIASEGIIKMQANMDALVIVQNDNLLKLPENRSLSFVDAFKAADTVLLQAIQCIAELILTTGFINVDFADVTTIFQQSTSSEAILGIGQSNISAIKAVQNALESPLIDRSFKGARGMILNITGDNELSLYEVNEAADYILSKTESEVNMIFGVVINRKMKGVIQAMIIATDFSDSLALKAPQISTIPRNNISVSKSFDFTAPPISNFQKTETNAPSIIQPFNFNRDNNDK